MSWTREIYPDMYAATGGVPVPDDVNGGVVVDRLPAGCRRRA